MTIPISCCKRYTEICRKRLIEIKTKCRRSGENITGICDVETNDVNIFGCDRAIKIFIYANAFFVGINLLAYICFFILWIIKRVEIKKKKEKPQSETTTTPTKTKPAAEKPPVLLEKFTTIRPQVKDSVSSGFIAHGQVSNLL